MRDRRTRLERSNAACKTIQDRLVVTTGDLAATVLSGGTIEGELGRYVRAELEAGQRQTRQVDACGQVKCAGCETLINPEDASGARRDFCARCEGGR